MNFDYTEEQVALRDLVEQIVADKVDHASLRALEATDGRVDTATWKALADAGVLTALLPESAGGAGVGMVGIGAVLEVIGKHAAAVPLYPTIVLGAVAIAEFGTDAQKELLASIGSGETIATAALADGDVAATATDGSATLSGSVSFVPSGLDADVVLVAAGDAGVAVVPTTADGLTVESIPTTTGYPEARLVFDNVSGELLGGGSDPAQAAWIRNRADVGICALTTGICDGALELLSTYANQREQFNRVIASFQAVSQRAGDSYIDTEAVRLTARSAAWRLDDGQDALAQIAIARWWAAEAGHRVVHASTHIHGGVGVDRDYPLHRHFLMSRQLELTLGGSEHQLARLGAHLSY